MPNGSHPTPIPPINPKDSRTSAGADRLVLVLTGKSGGAK